MSHEIDLDDEEMELGLEAERTQENSKRILGRLKRTLKPKIWEPIEWELDSHWCIALEIVTRDRVIGRKESGDSYFCQSTAIRHVYVNVSSCSYSDTYGGDVYIRLGNNRYLRMYVYG